MNFSGKVYGYARVSTPKQNIERQLRNILDQYPEAELFRDVWTGTTTDRPEWRKLRKRLRKGDTVIFDSVSRMSRDAEEGMALYEELFNAGVELVFLKEPHISTETYKKAASEAVPMTGTAVDIILEAINQYLLVLAKQQIRLAFEQSEKEVLDLHQRTKEGIQTAKLAGKQIGQKKGAKLTTKKSIAAKEVIRKHSKSFGGTLDDADCMKLAGCSRGSYYKYKRDLHGETSAL